MTENKKTAFDVPRGVFFIGDPRETHKQAVRIKAKLGVWNTFPIMTGDGKYVAQFIAYKTGTNPSLKSAKWETVAGCMVDSGLLALMPNLPKEGYADIINDEGDGSDEGYHPATKALFALAHGSERSGAIWKLGAITSTGYGDGGYPVMVRRNKAGEAIGVLLLFIDEGNSPVLYIGDGDS